MNLRSTEQRFAELAAESRKHPAYWKALAELKHVELVTAHKRLQAWLRWMKKQKAVAEWQGGRPSKYVAVVRIEAIDAALRGEELPKLGRMK